MSVPQKLKGRYEIKEILGQGGMGLVYRAYDMSVKRDVALKTLRDTPNRAALQLFYKECEVLAALSHPNIVEIFDIGEYYEGEGQAKPYFVMPLLPGATLDKLIKDASHRLTTDRVVEIACQAARGLQAAHERGLIHRDIKPSNLFVMDDDSVKIIDFGVAHLVEANLSVGAKGTLFYMAPEQLQMKPATPSSDIYSLGVACYEALTLRRPFDAPNQNEIVDAVLNRIPPPACDVNPSIGQALSRVIHKAMAKQPWNRYASAREFADTLQKGLRNEPIEFFNPARIQPRIERAAKAFEQGDAQFALEILGELEAEGHIDSAIGDLRRQIEIATKKVTMDQLVESARTRFEHEEYPLALQKIQEILEIEPGNAQALGLKLSIENKMTQQKLEEWIRLSRQHIENQAFGHAREALRNALEMKPGDTRAGQMLEDVDRLEQGFLKSRAQKEELYHDAMECWNSGEVTSALTKLERILELDRQSPEKSSPDRSAVYQGFYNKVRSEHETLKNSYAEARQRLSERNFAQALVIASDCLSRYPGHALFQALKFDIEEQRRQELSAKIAEIDRDLDGEADLDRRVHILEQSLAAYPGEQHFERQLAPLKEKRDLVNSIAAKARYHEERGQFADALAQWEILRTIYDRYPGLEFEIERVVKRRDQQARTESKARYIEQYDRAMQAGDYGKAGEAAVSAETEFPNDSEIADMKQRAQQYAANALEAQQAFTEAQALQAQQSFDQALAGFQRARELDPRNQAIRAALVEALAEHARALIDADLPAAEPLIQQALEIDPGHVLAKSLRTRALDHKRDQAVIRCFMLARQHRASGEIEKALAETEQCLKEYPLDPRLLQLHDILVKETEEMRRTKVRPADLEALRQLEKDALAAGEWADVQHVAEKAREIAARYPSDPEFQTTAANLERRLTEITSERRAALDSSLIAAFTAEQPPAASPASPPAAVPPPLSQTAAASSSSSLPGFAPPPPASDLSGTPTAPAAPPPPPSMSFPAASPDAPVATPSSTQVPEEGRIPTPPSVSAVPPPPVLGPGMGIPGGPARTQVPPVAPKPPKKKGLDPAVRVTIAVVACLLLLLGGAFLVIRKFRSAAPPPAGAVRVEIRTQPSGATVRVNGAVRGTSDFALEDVPGTYQIEATKDGYLPVSQSVKLAAGAPPVSLTLQPLPQTVRIFTDLAEGKVTLDDQPAHDLADGQATLDSVSPGQHTVKITSRTGEISFSFQLAPGVVPAAGAPVVKNLAALLVGCFGARARIYSSVVPARVEIDGSPVADMTAEGLEIDALTPGPHDLVVTSGKIQLKKVIEGTPAPVLTAFVQSDPNRGTLLILAGEDGASVYLDGRKYPRQTSRGGQLRISAAPKAYKVRIEKAGFQEVPEQTIQLAKGDEKKVVFQMTARPTSGRLALQGAVPGAQVFIDGALAGVVQNDGTFQLQTVNPGERTIELRRDRARSRAVRKTFAAGQTVRLTDAEVALRSSTGTLHFNVQPAGASISVARSGGGGQPASVMSGNSLDLEEGSYTVTVRANGYAQRTESVQVTGGQSLSVNIALAREARRPGPTSGMEGWPPDAWTFDGQWHGRRGGNIILYKPVTSPGVYTFSMMLSAGGGLLRSKDLEWILDYKDARNYVLFRLSKNEFRRILVVNGKRTEAVRKAHNLNLDDYLMTGLRIEVNANSVVTFARKAEQFVPLDVWQASDRNFSQARFGLNIEGRDEVRINGFTFTAKE